MAEKTKKPKLRDTDPVRYYKRKRHWLTFGRCLCLIVPALAVLLTYAVRAWLKMANTNPLNPVQFGLGIALMVTVIIVVVLSQLRAVTKENKKSGQGPQFTSAFVWLLIALILWLLYISTYYIIIFCGVEFIASFTSAFFTSAINQTYIDQDKEDTAERQAKAISRAMEEKKSKVVPIE